MTNLKETKNNDKKVLSANKAGKVEKSGKVAKPVVVTTETETETESLIKTLDGSLLRKADFLKSASKSAQKQAVRLILDDGSAIDCFAGVCPILAKGQVYSTDYSVRVDIKESVNTHFDSKYGKSGCLLWQTTKTGQSKGFYINGNFLPENLVKIEMI